MVFIIFDSGVFVMVNRHHVCKNSTNYQEIPNHDKNWVNTSKQVLAYIFSPYTIMLSLYEADTGQGYVALLCGIEQHIAS